MTGRRAAPPPGARKVEGLKVWVTESGEAWGPYGRLTEQVMQSSAYVGVMRETGEGTTRSLALLVAEAWLPPKPAGSKLVHLNGRGLDNRASNLAWAPVQTQAQYYGNWKRRLMAAMAADPGHPQHGTHNGYKAGCRCTRCRNAQRLAFQRFLTRRLIREVEGRA